MQRRQQRLLAAGFLLLEATAWAAGIVKPGSVKLQDVTVSAPSGWRLAQEASQGDVSFALFSNGVNYVRLYTRRGEALDARAMFVNGSRMTRDPYREQRGRHEWTRLETRKDGRDGREVHVAAFQTAFRGATYYGYGSAASVEAARANVEAILDAIQ